MHSKNILIIDDDHSLCDLYVRLLKKIDIEKAVVCINDGSEALNYLKSLKDDNFPDLIILDYEMPVLDGLQFLESYQKNFYPRFSKTKVIFSSSHDQKNISRQLNQLACLTDISKKPITLNKWNQLLH